jgi:hypothetical protein
MVDLHGLGIDVRLERIEGVGQRRQHERAGRRRRGGGSRGSRLGKYNAWHGCGGGDARGGTKKMTAR